jgi:hypothetical protein
MPLNRQQKVIGSCSLQRLDDAVVRTARHDAQTFSNGIGCLVRRGVYRERQLELGFIGVDAVLDATQVLVGSDFHRVRHCHLFSRFVIHSISRRFRQEIRDVLDQRTVAVDIQALQAIADRQHRLSPRIGVIQ